MGKDRKTPSVGKIAERDILIACLIVAIGLVAFRIGYLGGRDIGAVLFS